MADAGLSSLDLAKASGIHPVTISHLLNRRQNAKPETAAAIAGALGVDAAGLHLTDGGAA